MRTVLLKGRVHNQWTLLPCAKTQIQTAKPPCLLCLSLSPSARGGSHHVVGAETAEGADGADHFPVHVCLPGPHSVPQELPPHLSPVR